jgi:arabinofuranosyltransferase
MLQLALLLVPLVVLAVMAWTRRWTADDGFINLRIVRQILAGNGPVFNAGDRVETGTSPMWLGLLALLDVLTPIRLEWIAAIAGIATTVGGLAFATFGTRAALDAVLPRGSWLLPLGALAYAAVPAAWDFSTSGLETGLGLLWLALVWWILCRRAVDPTAREHPPPVWVAVVAGLGPLVRPDFLLFSAAFVVALVVTGPVRVRVVVRIVLCAAALPVLGEVARMAYFASLVPNTAIAKEAGQSYWSQGLRYLDNFSWGFEVWIPLVVLLVLVVAELRRADWATTRPFALVSLIVAASGLLHAAYVTRVGGDFMVGRMLLPAYFVVLLPASVVSVEGWRWAAAAAVCVWAVLCIGWLRPAVDATGRIVDERHFWVTQASTPTAARPNPVTIDDYASNPAVASGRRDARRAARHEDRLVLQASQFGTRTAPLAPDVPQHLVGDVGPLGLFAYSAGIDVGVVDVYGLADPVASHTRADRHARPGHQKFRSEPWVVARYTAPGTAAPGVDGVAIAFAREALSCGDLARLERDTRAPLDPAQMARNVVDALGLTRLRYSRDPVVAARELCGRG